MLDAAWHHERVARAQHHRRLAAVGGPYGDVELAVEHEEELVGVLVHVPDVLAQGVCDPYVVVVDLRHDARAVDVVERGEGAGEVHGHRDGGHCQREGFRAGQAAAQGAEDWVDRKRKREDQAGLVALARWRFMETPYT